MLRKLGIEAGEGRVVAWGAATLVLTGWADVSVKNVSEIFFLKRVGVEFLPLVFLVNSVLLVGTTYVVGRLAAGRDRLRLLPRVLAGLALALVPLWFLVLGGVTSVFALLVIASKQLESIALLVFWIAMGDLLHGRQAKRLFAPLMAGFTLGTIVGSFASDPIGRALGIHGLLPFSAAALASAGALAFRLRRLRPTRLERGRGDGGFAFPTGAPPGRSGQPVASLAGLWRDSWLFRLLFLTTLFSGLLGPMLYFQFQYVADLATTGEGGEERLLALYAQFRGWISIGVLATQLAVTSGLYRRIGIPLSAALSPAVYFLGFIGLSIRLSLPAGIGAMALTKLQDEAIYDPALRILFNLFPEEMRARASALLEGPVKRAGGALGNVAILGALTVGTAVWVGYAALPIAGLWMIVALVVWRRYPALLLQASARRSHYGEAVDLAEMLDPVTLRVLSTPLTDPDPARCRAAIELVSEAKPALAAGSLAEAARDAPDATRPMLVAALDRLLESSVGEPVTNEAAGAALEALLAEPGQLQDPERADAVQAYHRLTRSRAGARPAVLERALADPAPAVRLAAVAACHQRGDPPAGAPDLDAALDAAVAGDDAAARRTAREELRALLLCSEPDARWEARLATLAQLLARPSDQVEAAEALADVAERHGSPTAVVGGSMFALCEDPDPRIRAALLRFSGHAGLHARAEWVLGHVGSAHPGEASAARDGLRAFGATAADVLLVELSFGMRSTRNAILSIIRDLDVKEETLRNLYQRELELVRGKLASFLALRGSSINPIVLQRIEERIEEGLHTALLLLAAIEDEDRIAELCDLLKRAREGRQRAILLEALEALLGPQQKAELMPLLEYQRLGLRRRSAETVLGTRIVSAEEASLALLEDPDELTCTLALATQSDPARRGADLAAPSDVEDHHAVLSPVEIVIHLKSLPIFERLTTRQLMDLAGAVREETHPPDTAIVREGDYSDCIYLIIEGVVHVTKGETVLAELGPKNFFGEIAVFEGTTRSATVATRSRVRLLRLERNDLLRLMEELPGIAIGICQTLSQRVRELTGRVQA